MTVPTVVIKLVKRPMWKRVLIAPKIFWGHYKILRKGNSVYVSAYAALMLTRVLFTP